MRVTWARILAAITITIAMLGGIIAAGATPARAASGNQWCDELGYCPNAWGGGPFVKTYAYSTRNNDFTVIGDYWDCNGGYTTSTCPGYGFPAGYPIVAFEFTGGGSWNGQCIGDAYNDPGRADSSLDPCPNGNTGGWGVNFVQFTPASGCPSDHPALFYNIHWTQRQGHGGFDWPANNGSTIYLNNPASLCLAALPPA